MPRVTRRRVFAAVALLVLLAGTVATVLFERVNDFKARSTQVSVGMTRDEVLDRLGPPDLEMLRVNGKGTLLVWVDQKWQVDVFFGPDGRVESVAHSPAHSLYRETLGRVLPAPE